VSLLEGLGEGTDKESGEGSGEGGSGSGGSGSGGGSGAGGSGGSGGTGGSGGNGTSGSGGSGDSGSGGGGGNSGSGGSGGSGGGPGGSAGQTTILLTMPNSSSPQQASTSAKKASRVAFLSHRVHGGVATIVLWAPGAGRLTLAGRGVHADHARAIEAERIVLKVRLSSASVASLRRSHHHSLEVKLKASFQPASGSGSSARMTIVYR
jgi:hypothetical protein